MTAFVWRIVEGSAPPSRPTTPVTAGAYYAGRAVERYAGIGITLALATAYVGVAATSPVSVGLWRDDGIYVVTGAALAAGDGYRHEELASRPLQTKYPILYPALLSAVVRATADFPANHAWLLLPTALAAAALVTLSMRYCRVVFGLPARAVWPLGALVAASPALVAFVRYPMSELVYGALAVGALLCLDERREAAADSRRVRGAGSCSAACWWAWRCSPAPSV